VRREAPFAISRWDYHRNCRKEINIDRVDSEETRRRLFAALDLLDNLDQWRLE
jgi:hypothetical protein